jgi:hypothetical protein
MFIVYADFDMPKSPESSNRGKKDEFSSRFQREREADLEWITLYLDAFATAARQQYAESGRGALVIDTNEVVEGFGHPVSYLPQAEIEKLDEPDIRRIVGNYRPETQMVVVLIKAGYSHSTYSVVMPPVSPEKN